jgi:hypothetical protein
MFVLVLFVFEHGRQHVTDQFAQKPCALAECLIERDQLAPHQLPFAG